MTVVTPIEAHLLTATRLAGQPAAIVCGCGFEAPAASLTAAARAASTHVAERMAALAELDPGAEHLLMLLTVRTAFVSVCRCGWASRAYRHPERGLRRLTRPSGSSTRRVFRPIRRSTDLA